MCIYIYTYIHTYFQQECFYISKLYEILLYKNVILYETLIYIYIYIYTIYRLRNVTISKV